LWFNLVVISNSKEEIPDSDSKEEIPDSDSKDNRMSATPTTLTPPLFHSARDLAATASNSA
jgi:hypothetical protein